MNCCCEDPRDPVKWCPAHTGRWLLVKMMGRTLHDPPRVPNGYGTGPDAGNAAEPWRVKRAQDAATNQQESGR